MTRRNLQYNSGWYQNSLPTYITGIKARLHLVKVTASAMALRDRSQIKSMYSELYSFTQALTLLDAIVQHQNNRIDLVGISQRRRRR